MAPLDSGSLLARVLLALHDEETMKIPTITLACALGLAACTAESKPSTGTPAVKKDVAGAKKGAPGKNAVAMTEQKLELDKVP